MGSFVVGFYWFVNGVFFVLFVRRAIKTKKVSIGWLLGLGLAVLVGVLLLFGATVCFDHFSAALLSNRAFLYLVDKEGLAPAVDSL